MFTFKHVAAAQRELIHTWTAQAYIQEWLHGEGYDNLLKNLDHFFEGKTEDLHWIAYDKETPFGYLLTSPIRKEQSSDDLARWCLKKGEAIALDLFICDPRYIGKGFAHIMIKEFLLSQFPHITEVLIGPEASNQRAVHVYEKAGFHIIGDFIASWHPVPHYMMHLDMSDLLPRKEKAS